MKRILKILGGILVVICVVAAIGLFWFVESVKGNLEPPPNPEGQASIAQYVREGQHQPPIAKPDLKDDFSWDKLLTPPKSARAWTRWWWPGGDVDAKTAAEQLEELDAAGFGGVEIQPFLGGVIALADNDDVMARVYSFDSPTYYETLRSTITAADSLGMKVDLTHFSGWPPGGPEVNLEDSLTMIAYGETSISGGKRVEIALPKPKAGPSEYIFAMLEFAGADFINFPVKQARLVSVLASKVEQGKHAGNPFNLNDSVALNAESAQVVTAMVQGDTLVWDAPEGDWTIVASYLMPSGEVPMGAAQKPQGFVVDHLRRPQVIGHYEYAYGERTGLPSFYGDGLRGFFNDSLEFRIKRLSAEGILEEFRTRRGYDLEPWLPAIYVEGMDNVYFRELLGVHAAPEFTMTDADERIRHDYQLTISELMIERFIETSAEWAESRGLVSRAQSYGMDIDILRALGSNTIPETEQLWAGGADVGLKFASSAAALYGQPLVSAESFVWVNRDYMPTARRIKAATDKMLLAGINHIIYHGTPYPWWGTEPSPFGEEGWQPFSGPQNPAHFSSNVSSNNASLWPDIPDLNAYIARSQYLLRQGSPEVDVLVYYPWLGFHGPNPEHSPEALVGGALADADPDNVAHEDPMLSEGKRQLEKVLNVPSKHKDERVSWVEELQPILRELDQRGISWGWVNAHALETGRVANGLLKESGGRYRAILMHDVTQIELSAIQAVKAQVTSGVPVFLIGDKPYKQSGFKEYQAGDKKVRREVDALIDAGAIVHEQWSQESLQAIQEATASDIAYGDVSTIKRNRRILSEGGIQFFANQSAAPAELHISLPAGSHWWFDAVKGTAFPLDERNGAAVLSLGGFESRFLISGVELPQTLKSTTARFANPVGQRRKLSQWSFSAGSFTAEWSELPDWRSVAALKHEREGTYHHTLSIESLDSSKHYYLDLGLVQGSAEVRVNGNVVGRASLPPFALDVSKQLKIGENRIEISVTAPLRNVFVGKALNGDPQYSHMERYANELVAAGLIGPVEFITSD